MLPAETTTSAAFRTTRTDSMCLRIGVGRLHADSLAVLGENPLDVRVRQHRRAGVGGILQVGTHGALLGAGLIAHAAVADQRGVVAVRVDVERRAPVGIPQLARTVGEALMRPVLRGDLSLHPIRSNTSCRCSSNAGESTSTRPCAAAQSARTVAGVSSELDQLTVLRHRPCAAGRDADHPVGGGKNPPRRNSPDKPRVRTCTKSDSLRYHAALEDDHPLSCFAEHSRGDPAAAARADHDDVRLERRLTLRGENASVFGCRRRPGPGPDIPFQPTTDCDPVVLACRTRKSPKAGTTPPSRPSFPR